MSSSARHASVRVNLGRPPEKARPRSAAFDVQLFLDSTDLGRTIDTFRQKEIIFSQGDPANNVMYIQEGRLKLTVVSTTGQEAIVAILRAGDFCGESCLKGQSLCTVTATAIAPTTVLVIEKDEMIRTLHRERDLSDRFIAYMLSRNTRLEGDLIDQLFNSSERRLARTLLLLAGYSGQDQPHTAIAKMSQETLAEMVGTTRSRVNLFMNKFRKLGFIEYGVKMQWLQINKSLLSVVLQD